MTSKQKSAKLETIRQMILIAGFKLDSYGSYQRTLQEIKYKIKLKPINIRIERKNPESTTWHKVISQPIVSIDLTKLATWAAKFCK